MAKTISHKLGRILLMLGATGALAVGCAISGFDLGNGDTAAAQGGGSGATSSSGIGGSTSSVGGGSCVSDRWPDPPAMPGSDTSVSEIVVAVRSVDFGEEDLSNGPTVGYDLDQRCTCAGDGDSCQEPAFATADHCDGPGGVDNAVAQLFAAASIFNSDLTSANQSARAESGAWTLLIRVRGYNGEANDDRVDVTLLPSPGLDAHGCAPGVAAWDGNDAYPVDSTALIGTPTTGPDTCNEVTGLTFEEARYRDSQAYVTEGRLVASLPDASLVLSGSNSQTSLKLVGGFISGDLSQQGTSWHINNGVLAGRWRLEDFFVTLSTLTSSDDPICTDHPLYSALKNAICSYPDIGSTLGGPSAPCDALSFGMGFEAEPAQLGIIWQGAGTLNNCPPATDPSNDNCSN